MEMSLLSAIAPYVHKKIFSEKIMRILWGFVESYEMALHKRGLSSMDYLPIIELFIRLAEKQILTPYQFPSYHHKMREPEDYFKFGNDFLRPMIDMKESTLTGLKSLIEIDKIIKNGENVVLLANHQIEADPQVISIMLEKDFPYLSEEMIFVAGERVLVDPLATPFSMGRNLLCIYSKKYMDIPPEKKEHKQTHNKRTMEKMRELLNEGGKCIYVAPSGGRDRPNHKGVVEVAPFDPQSIEMFHLMARRSSKKVHFYPLSLSTYCIMPPPDTIQIELGEARRTGYGPVHLHFGHQIDMDHIEGVSYSDKHAARKVKADYIHHLVEKSYKNFRIT
jgi:glycerol-3-phosphate O-acyltransferase